MKKTFILAFILILFTASLCYSANIKAILVIADDYINPANNNIAQSVRNDLDLLISFLDLLEYKKVATINKTILRGRSATVDKIKETIGNLITNKDDVIFFYYCGHGGMTNNKTFIWPCDENMLFRDDLEQLINRKTARLKLLITDACSSSIDTMQSYSFTLGSGASRGAVEGTDIYKKLFDEYKGLLHITSATEGEYAWGGPEGGAFTTSFVKETLLQSPTPSWNENFKKAQESTERKFQYSYKNGGFDYNTMEDLRRKGITNQKPKAYSMPSEINETNTNTNTNNNNNNNNNNKLAFFLKNYTNYKIPFSLTDGKDTQQYTLNPYEETNVGVKNSSVTVSYNKGNGKYDTYSLEANKKYHFGVDEYSLIQLYTTLNENQIKTKVRITNETNSQIKFTIDYGDYTQNYALNAGYYQEYTDDNDYIYISYNKGNGAIDYYALEQGSYTFSKDKSSLFQLYYMDSTGEKCDDSYYEEETNYKKTEIYIYNYTEWKMEFVIDYSAYSKMSLQENISVGSYEYYSIPTETNVVIRFSNGYSQELVAGQVYIFIYDPTSNMIYLLTYDEFLQYYGG